MYRNTVLSVVLCIYFELIPWVLILFKCLPLFFFQNCSISSSAITLGLACSKYLLLLMSQSNHNSIKQTILSCLFIQWLRNSAGTQKGCLFFMMSGASVAKDSIVRGGLEDWILKSSGGLFTVMFVSGLWWLQNWAQ